MIRDLCVARTGSWSGAAVLAHAELLGYRARKTVALAAIKAAIGAGNRRSGPRGNSVPDSVPHSVPGTELIRFPRKRKEAKEKEPRAIPPSGTSYPPDPQFGDLEAEAELYVAAAAEGNKSGKITLSRRLSLRIALFAVLEELADRDAFAYGLRAANAKGACNPNYVRKAALNAPLFGSRPSQNGVVSDVSNSVPGSRYQQPTQQQLELAARAEDRERRRREGVA